MNVAYEAALIEHCRDVVCPNDPTAVIQTTVQAHSPGVTYGAEGGGHITGEGSGLQMQTTTAPTENGDDPTVGGSDVKNLKLYLGVGIAALAVLYFLKKKK